MKNFWNKPITWGAYFKYFFALPMVIYMIIVAVCMRGLKYTNWKRNLKTTDISINELI